MKTKSKPKAKLIGADSNIFNLMGLAGRALKDAGLPEQEKEMYAKIQGEAHSFDEALSIILQYVDPK